MKKLLIAIMVSFLLLAFGCASTSNGTTPKTNQESTAASQPNTAKDPYNVCFSEASTSQGSSIPKFKSCLINIAVETGNESVCKYNFGFRYECECFLKVSEKKGVGVCESDVFESNNGETYNFADDCYTYIAAKKRDANLCDLVKIETRKASCIAIANRNVDLCPEFSTECVKMIASLEMNPEICAHAHLNSTCIANIAVIKKDPTVCNFLDESERSGCINAIANNAKFSPESFGGCYQELNGDLDK
ncbi:MAG: hypothetical protein NTV88_03385 [Candidatus Micrarchaeota archaeon]|nr:hypothetical protein [Candidatus Micrarchaeota archaeon]